MDIIDDLIRRALAEDMPGGDITTEALFGTQRSAALLLAKEDGVLAGIDIARRVYQTVDPEVLFTAYAQDGETLKKGQKIASVQGPTKSLLKGERVALNFLQRMSGIATLTRLHVDAVAGTGVKILDTRKTTPTLRILEKMAVKAGGGTNHRMSLSDMAMIKDNHIQAAGSITSAVRILKEKYPVGVLIEVEVESLDQYREALKTPADIVMLDNMSVELMAACAKIPHPGKRLEASGNMTLDRLRAVAGTGVDFISIGALTHSFHSLDISMRFQ